jgi:hypothetical protein
MVGILPWNSEQFSVFMKLYTHGRVLSKHYLILALSWVFVCKEFLELSGNVRMRVWRTCKRQLSVSQIK